ncbi:zinc-ribbon domain-containing protein [Bacillus cereus]|uniref:Putative zinc ribbon protein n=1 Tax=Bacillus thuringiensis TaxID=1428 RepID=A0A4V2WBM8_BACTU|nr:MULTISPECIES: zinc-ribbon domain-containing protein [Bacillus cereus group]MED2041094.1 zinc-ribbon domain-containing protein [Bacillus wiedmannii]MED2186267.1 zinc-ribbon domain-containing protein [Bacillus wiedmannii]TCW43376.1 putative zinc ribbon protein [Bacillus thuringiensis]TCW44121.1 putative zinc ribbon protein [Bacillus thuringiensis]UPJ18261.1 zinc-ribbon domain-containing protein [Bacillus cereus]
MENRLAIRKPKLSKQWHETKNGKLTPFDVTYSSDKKNCEKGHE